MLFKTSDLYNDYHCEHVIGVVISIFDCCIFILVETNIVRSEIICKLSKKIRTNKLQFSFSFFSVRQKEPSC